MNKVVVKSLIGQNGESLGAYVDYDDFCKMQSEYEEQIEKMKCCGNCNKYRKAKCTEDDVFYARTTRQCKEWEIAE